MPRIKDFAIVLRESDWSETSQVVTLLSLEHGKFRGLAKGSKRPSPSNVARFSGGIEPITRGQIVASLKPVTGLSTLTEWDLLDPYPHLRNHWPTLQLAWYAVDLANALLPDHEPHPQAYEALSVLLTELMNPDAVGGRLLLYQWSMLASCGYAPRLQLELPLTSTGDPTTQGTCWFDPLEGGVMSETSVAGSRAIALRSTQSTISKDDPGVGPWRVRCETVQLLKTLAEAGALPGDMQKDQRALQRANRLLCAYARHVLDRELPTMGAILRDRNQT